MTMAKQFSAFRRAAPTVSITKEEAQKLRALLALAEKHIETNLGDAGTERLSAIEEFLNDVT